MLFLSTLAFHKNVPIVVVHIKIVGGFGAFRQEWMKRRFYTPLFSNCTYIVNVGRDFEIFFWSLPLISIFMTALPPDPRTKKLYMYIHICPTYNSLTKCDTKSPFVPPLLFISVQKYKQKWKGEKGIKAYKLFHYFHL